jgi:hypothetical protein
VDDKTRALRVNLSRTSARVRLENSSPGFGEVGKELRGRRTGTMLGWKVGKWVSGEWG